MSLVSSKKNRRKESKKETSIPFYSLKEAFIWLGHFIFGTEIQK